MTLVTGGLWPQCQCSVKTHSLPRLHLLTFRREELFSAECVLAWGTWGLLTHMGASHKCLSLLPLEELFSAFLILATFFFFFLKESCAQDQSRCPLPCQGITYFSLHFLFCIFSSSTWHFFRCCLTVCTVVKTTAVTHHCFTLEAGNS